MNEKIIGKIQKLLALSESSNDHESQSAILKAQKLLIKHKLSMKEVKEYKQFNSSIIKDISKVSFKGKAKWKGELAEVLADNFGCYIYFKTLYTHYIVFLGREEDVIVCNMALEYAVDCIESAVKRLRYIYSNSGESTKGLSNDYALGFIRGLNEKFEEQKRKNQEWGIILVKDKEVAEVYDNMDFKGTVNIGTQYTRHKEAFYQGYDDGKEFSISNKITEEEKEDSLILK